MSPYGLFGKDAGKRKRRNTRVFIWGAPGIGKTEMVYQIANEWGLRTVALHLPEYDPTDLKGVVVRMEDGSVKWVTTSYLPQTLEEQIEVSSPAEHDFKYRWLYAQSVRVIVRDRKSTRLNSSH